MNEAPPDPLPWLRARAARCRNIGDLRAGAARRLPRAIFDFIDGGAETEATLRGNEEALARLRLVPRVLVDVAKLDTGTDILGTQAALPMAVGPTGGTGFVWPRGDIALARAAHAMGIPFTLSTTAAVSIEDLRDHVPGRLWMQTYIFRQREVTHRLIARAAAAGYEALVITVDFPVAGNRERDYRNDFSVPFRFTPKNVTDFALHPEWVWTTVRKGMPAFGNLTDFTPGADAAGVASSVGRNYDPSFAWPDLAAIRDRWPGKLIVKGVAHPRDAERLAAMGVDAIAVSNHGGRQLDASIATADAFPAVRAAVGGRAQVFLDGGLRRGTDIVKALALGADAVLVGRATLFGLAAAGQAGAERALQILSDELARTMRLCGTIRIADMSAAILATPAGAGLSPEEPR